MRNAAKMIFALGVLGLSLTSPVSPANADPLTTEILNLYSQKCWDVVDRSRSNNAKVQQYTCHGGTNQQFMIYYVEFPYFAIEAVHSGKCLDVTDRSTARGAKLQQYSCHYGTNQQFRVDPTYNWTDGNLKYYRWIRPRHSEVCLAVDGFSQSNKARIVQANVGCSASSNQLFAITTPGDIAVR